MSFAYSGVPVPRRSPSGVIFLLVGVVTFIGLAVAAVLVGVSEQRKADWPVTDGTVVDVVERQSTRRDNDGDRRTSTTWAPVVTYTVEGKDYQFTSSTSTSSIPTVGDTVQVRYNPDSPSEAGLAQGLMWVVFMLGGMAVLFLVIFGGVGLAIVRRQRSAPPPVGPYQQWNHPGAEPDGPIDPSQPR